MKNKNRECQILRQQISEIRDMLKPYSAVSYKSFEIPKLHDVYGNDYQSLVDAKILLLAELKKAILYGDNIRDKTVELLNETEDGGVL